MATIPKALLDLLTNSKTAKFAESLKHSDLPTGWADDPEIVDLAAKAWQEAGTESPFFKAWFGGSKAVGKDKAPSKYYHATTKDFDIFDAPAIESGYHARPAGLAFFTDKPSVADTYVRKEMLNAFSPEKWEDGANMMEVFLNLEKPIKVNARGSYWNDIPYKDDYLQTNDLGALAKESTKNDGVIIKNVRDEGRGRDWKNAEPLKSTVAITTDPTQIKSTFNRGTFNPEDPNIMHTLAPLGVGTAAMAAALLGGGDEAKAAAINAALADPASREKAAAAGLPYDPPVEESAWSPADLLVAPVGAVGIPAKLLAMALDAPVTLGIDAGLSALGGLFGGGERKKPGGW